MAKLSDFDYDLPESAIAQTPLDDRASSRLLHLNRTTGEIEHLRFRDVTEVLQPGDLLVLNDTRVSALRLRGKKTTGANVELLLLRPLSDDLFGALAKPGARLQPGARCTFPGEVEALVEQNLEGGQKLVRLSSNGPLDEALRRAGTVPLPPYIRAALDDPERYQTVYGSRPGSAAAPTAGLHFTREVLADVQAKGIRIATVTLDVGLDTFRPIKDEDLGNHRMHGELCSIPPETADAVSSCRGRIVAVGTTAVRTLESFGEGHRRVRTGAMTTDIFIQPGYEFRVIDGMFTNFHMPRTTMLVMLAALIGRNPLMKAYAEALEQGYRFLSFGDSMLIL